METSDKENKILVGIIIRFLKGTTLVGKERRSK
jgi:hypothetical protein